MTVFLSRAQKGQHGFSLIEVLVSITVFAVITLGITPLIVSSLRGSNLSRSLTRSKNLVQEAMERVRGFPYFDTAANRDVLDLYYPNLTSSAPTGYDSTDHSFTTICTSTSSLPAGTGVQACPPRLSDGTSRIPVGHTMTFKAQFVVPAGAAPEVFTPQPPTAGYTSSDPALAIPPAQLVRLTITMSWSQLGKTRTFTLASLIGDRKLSPDKARGSAVVDFVVDTLTSYKRLSDGRITRLSASAGRSNADVEVRNLASAAVESKAGEILLTAQDSATSVGQRLATVSGATSARITAPPNQPALTAIDDTDPSETVLHPDLGLTPVAFLANGSRAMENLLSSPSPPGAPGIQVVNNLPRAISNFLLNPAAGSSMWVDNQADTSNTALRKLDPLSHVLTVSKLSGQRLQGATSVDVTAVTPTATRKVESIASSAFGRLELLPTTFISGSGGVVVIDNFASSMTCKSTGSLATSSATGRWDATFKYYADTDDNGIPGTGGYVTVLSGEVAGRLSGSTASTYTDQLAALVLTNPVVYDGPGAVNDVYLFEETGKLGYLKGLSSTNLVPSQLTATQARVNMEQAITITTAQTDPLNEETQLTVNIGKSSCEAADRRG